MLNVFILSLIASGICAVITTGIGVVISIISKDDKCPRLIAGAVIFAITFIYMAFMLYASCIEQTWLAVARWIWPPLVVGIVIYAIMQSDEYVMYELISTIVLTVISICIYISACLGPVQNLVYVHDMKDIDVTYAVKSDEILSRVELKIDKNINGWEKYYIESPEMREVNKEDIAVYQIKDKPISDIWRDSTEYIPGYAIQRKGELPEIVSKRIYFDTSYINRKDALRTVRRKYPTTVIGRHKFDIDDDWNPYEVFEYREKKYSTDGKDYGLIILNLMDGTCEKYVAGTQPNWVDYQTTYPR